MTSTPHSLPPTGPVTDTCSHGQVAGRYAHDGYTVVWVRGEIDIATAPELMRELAGAVGANQCRVVVDLTQVTFMDASGLNALVLARGRAEASSGEFRLVGTSGMVCKILHITGLDQFFSVHSTIEESMGPTVQHNGTAVQHPAHAKSWPESLPTWGVLGPLG